MITPLRFSVMIVLLVFGSNLSVVSPLFLEMSDTNLVEDLPDSNFIFARNWNFLDNTPPNLDSLKVRI